MPVHDWTRTEAGDFHHFHQTWTIIIANHLNSGVLPTDYFAMADQVVGGPIPDVVTLKHLPRPSIQPKLTSNSSVLTTVPKTQIIQHIEPNIYAKRANRVIIKHRRGDVVAIIEIVSPGNKQSIAALRAFVHKASDAIEQGIHLLIIDLFPPTPRDPQGIHGAIWDELNGSPFTLPADKPLSTVAYACGDSHTAYVEPFAVGDPLPDMPLFLTPTEHILIPLEQTYQQTWNLYPQVLKELLEHPEPNQ